MVDNPINRYSVGERDRDRVARRLPDIERGDALEGSQGSTAHGWCVSWAPPRRDICALRSRLPDTLPGIELFVA